MRGVHRAPTDGVARHRGLPQIASCIDFATLGGRRGGRRTPITRKRAANIIPRAPRAVWHLDQADRFCNSWFQARSGVGAVAAFRALSAAGSALNSGRNDAYPAQCGVNRSGIGLGGLFGWAGLSVV